MTKIINRSFLTVEEIFFGKEKIEEERRRRRRRKKGSLIFDLTVKRVFMTNTHCLA